jgi:hypothetical protein
METIHELIAHAELLINYAIIHGVSLPPPCVDTLLASKGQAAALSVPGQARTDFYKAFSEAVKTIDKPVAEILEATSRRSRMEAMLADARTLLEFAAANGKKIDDETRNPLVEAGDVIEQGAATVVDEQKFLKAYEALSVKTAPVTAESIRASKTTLPHLFDILSSRNFTRSFRQLTLGRFFHVIFFGSVLYLACSAVSFYSLGNAAQLRYEELRGNLAKLESELPAKLDSLKLRDAELRKAKESTPKDSTVLDAAQKSFDEAKRIVEADKRAIEQTREEHEIIPERLWKWSQLPCEDRGIRFLYRPICSEVDAVSKGTPPPKDIVKMHAARTVASRMGDIYLPLLLGFLGAYAFILRNLATQIATSSLARGSAIQHSIRLGTGALAGFASAWLLRPELMGGATLKYLPSWALAFIAGYGIELVFSFMDRIVSAFTERRTGG